MTAAAAMFFFFGIVAVHVFWPGALSLALAIGGTVGALLVLYEVRLTKRIAQAEFIRDLQSSFTQDPEIGILWRKILLEEEITPADRYHMSNYLTFFETLHILHMRDALDFALTDDLFRNRFFRAIGHPVVLRETILKSPESFRNIRALIDEWMEYCFACDVPTHRGYATYETLRVSDDGFTRVELGPDDLGEVLDLQRVTLESLGKTPILRENSAQMFAECLSDPAHQVLAWRSDADGTLASLAILYDAGTGPESIRRYETVDAESLTESINLKLVMTRPGHKRAGLSRSLILGVEQAAIDRGKHEIRATIHPDNTASLKLFGALGYRRVGKTTTSYGPRVIVRRTLATS